MIDDVPAVATLTQAYLEYPRGVPSWSTLVYQPTALRVPRRPHKSQSSHRALPFTRRRSSACAQHSHALHEGRRTAGWLPAGHEPSGASLSLRGRSEGAAPDGLVILSSSFLRRIVSTDSGFAAKASKQTTNQPTRPDGMAPALPHQHRDWAHGRGRVAGVRLRRVCGGTGCDSRLRFRRSRRALRQTHKRIRHALLWALSARARRTIYLL